MEGIVVTLFFTCLIALVAGRCPTGYTLQHDGNCYSTLSSSAVDRDNAANACSRNMGGRLPSISKFAQNVVLYNLARSAQSNVWLGLTCNSGASCTWDDGTKLDYSNLMSEQNFADGPCLYMNWTNGYWYSSDCSASYNYFCQIRVDQSSAVGGACKLATYWNVAPFNWCYFTAGLPLSFHQAQQYCSELGARLAVIDNADENDNIAKFFAANHSQNNWQYIMIGGTNPSSSDNYSNYEIGHPNIIYGECTAMNIQVSPYQWRSVNCNLEMPFVCQQQYAMRSMNHRRFNPLKDEWVIVAANRVNRPWQGAVEKPTGTPSCSAGGFSAVPDSGNPLAPGGLRSNGVRTPHYTSTYVFDNDFPTMTDPDDCEGLSEAEHGELFRAQAIRGACRVLCFHPRSDLSLATMAVGDIVNVFHMWIEQIHDLGRKFQWVQIFENKGAIVGCSNSHPHGQVWASDYLPNEPKTKDRTQKSYYEQHRRPLLVDYVAQELAKRERIVCENERWLAVVPYWAVWPFETMLLPKSHRQRLADLNEEEVISGAELLRELLIRYDNLFECSFPYSMGWHGAPTGPFLTDDCSHWQLHAVFLPPLLRSATVKKFMAGFELVCEPQRDLTPETVVFV